MHLSTNEALACTLPGPEPYFAVALAKAKGHWKFQEDAMES
jgi:hypothetical protein